MLFAKFVMILLLCSLLAVIDAQNGGRRDTNPNYAKAGQFPWHAVVYRLNGGRYEYVCGGTLISTNTVITATSCVYNQGTGRNENAMLYKVALGKLYRDYNGDPPNSGVQFVDVNKIRTSLTYRGHPFGAPINIAVLKLASAVNLTSTVNVARVELNVTSENSGFANTTKGTVAGWGLNNAESQKKLQWMDLPWIYRHKCLNETTTQFQKYLEEDMFCAGYVNRTKSLCAGDEGAGYMVLKRGRYYLRGVALAGPSHRHKDTTVCHSEHYTAFASFANNSYWVKREMDDQQSLGVGGRPIREGPTTPQLGISRSVTGSQVYQEGEPLHATCTVKDGRLASNLEWFIDDVIIQKGTSLPFLFNDYKTGLVTVVQHLIHNIRREDNGKELKCVAGHMLYGNKTSHTSKIIFVEFSSLNKDDIHASIVNGTPDDVTNIPYQLSLQYPRYTHQCSASIISPYWALTAAHCVKNISADLISLLSGTSKSYGGSWYRYGTHHEVVAIINHPKYNSTTLDYDASLLLVRDPFVYGRRTSAIKLPMQGQVIPLNSNALISGWGATEYQGKMSDELQSAVVPVLSEYDCKLNYGRTVITSQMICAGPLEGGKGFCKGDSGGALVVDGILFGVGSWSIGCAQKYSPGVYVKVSAIKNWITEMDTSDQI